jgi:thiamine-phosphate pyrophosphorylase
MRTIDDCYLYGIIDLGYVEKSKAVRAAEAMINGGVDLIQLRGKKQSVNELVDLSEELHELTSQSFTPLIVNDHAKVASKVPVEGVHLGQDDDSIEVARRKAGRAVVIGKSTHSLEQARAAQREGADYIGFGPIFGTATKETGYSPRGLSMLREVRKAVKVPIVAIGGITEDNVTQVWNAGADSAAIISDVMGADDVAAKVRRILALR